MDVSIAKTVYRKFKGIHYSEETQNIFEIIRRYGIKTRSGILTQTNSKLVFKSQVGGKKRLIKLENGKTYEYHVDTIVPYDDNKKQISFLNLTETDDIRRVVIRTSASETRRKLCFFIF
jgi:hypothetical protein